MNKKSAITVSRKSLRKAEDVEESRGINAGFVGDNLLVGIG